MNMGIDTIVLWWWFQENWHVGCNICHVGGIMEIDYEIKNQKLKKMVEKKANQLKIPVDQLILNYINRGVMGEGCNEDTFKKLHSCKFLKNVSEAWGVD